MKPRKSRRSRRKSKKESKKSRSRKLNTRLWHRPSQFQKKQSGSKYTDRPSPPYKANEFCEETMKGNDGHYYLSKKGSNGVCRWVRVQRYLTLDNGGSPYVVVIDGNQVIVYYYTEDEKYEKKVWSGKALDVFVGEDKPNEDWTRGYDWTKGTSVLVQIKPERYLFIGHTYFEFTVKKGDYIVKYYTPTGNSAVPYPFAVGKHNTYLMLDAYTKLGDVVTVLPHTLYHPIDEDPYQFFWHGNLTKRQQKNWPHFVKK